MPVHQACPSTPDGAREDCNMAPDIVSNSWGSSGGGCGAVLATNQINALPSQLAAVYPTPQWKPETVETVLGFLLE